MEVGPGEQRIEVVLDLVEIEGTVERGDDPVRARLHFQRLGTDAEGTPREHRIVFYTNPEGEFTGALPEAGEWSVQAALSARGGLIDLGAVAVDPGPRGVATLTLRVPDAALAGRVIDAAGEPVSEAVVWLDSLEETEPGTTASRSEARTGADGEFSFEAARPGRYRANALHDGRAATAEVEVVEGARTPSLTLTLEGLREIRGRVVGDSGGIAGARLVVFPDVADSARRSVRTLTTAGDGSFRLSVPSETFQVRGVLLAAGYAARVVRIPVGEGGGPVLLSVDRLAGTLDLQAGEGLGPDSVLFVDGTPIWLAMLQEWARTARGLTRPDRWVLPSMGVGSYRICNRSSECAEGFLHPGDTLVLQAGGS